jgi:hypothetical protein
MSWRRNLLGGVASQVLSFVLVVVEVFGGVAGCTLGLCCCQGAEGP